MKKLLLALTLAAGAGSLHSMEPQKQLSPIFLAQTYHQLTKLLLPDITQQIFSLHLKASGFNLTELEQSCKDPESFVIYLESLLKSCGYELASELCKHYFSHTKISICDIKGPDDWTALHYAAFEENTKTVNFLLNAADHNAWTLLIMKEINGETALYSSARYGRTEIVRFLLNAVGNKAYTLLTIKDDGGWTALHVAAFHGHTEIVKILLNAAGDKAQDFIAIPEIHGKTAYDIATPEVQEVMQTYLQK